MLPFTTNFLQCSCGHDLPVYDLFSYNFPSSYQTKMWTTETEKKLDWRTTIALTSIAGVINIYALFKLIKNFSIEPCGVIRFRC